MGATISPNSRPNRSIKDLFILMVFNIYTFLVKIIRPIMAFTMMPTVKKMVERKLERAGVEMNSLKIVKDEAYLKILLEGDLGAIESVMKGHIHYDGMKTFEQIFGNRQFQALAHPLYWLVSKTQLHLPMKAWGSGEQPGADLFKIMLDEHMQHSSGYWRNAANLKEAQEAKMELIAKKLHLKPGMRVLDINCTFGGLAKYLAKNYDVSVVGFSSSKQQKLFAEKLCKELPVEIRLGSYLNLENESEQFDRIVSVGTLETVTVNSYSSVLDRLKSVLKFDGILLLQEVGISHKSSPSLLWCQRYAHIPHHQDLLRAIDDHFIIEDWHNFGYDSYKTFEAWEKNLEKAWSKLVFRYGDEFRKLWKLYLHTFQAMGKTRAGQVWQIVLTKDGYNEGYQSYR